MALEVKSATISEVLKFLSTGAWQVPQFQRDFVWTEAQVISLVESIFAARPIGMVTLWQQPDEGQLPLEPVSISNTRDGQAQPEPRYICDPSQRPNQYYALLDGRQRSTALALVFGGLSPERGKFAGRFFLNAAEHDATKRIIFKKHEEVAAERLDTLSVCIGKGLFPLAIDPTDDKGLFSQWVRFNKEIRNPENYPDNVLPEKAELERREEALQSAFEGINDTKLAIYTVPDSYSLEDICDIFETLNTTGTKVSTVDLIHATLYQETQQDPSGGFDLRDWISELSQTDGTIGWADRAKRPEIIAQYVTACYVALDNKPEPRKKPGYAKENITSVKSGDLLATPADHWRNVVAHEAEFARYFGEFQRAVAGGYFALSHAPYPVSGAIYVALRWMLQFNGRDEDWGVDELNALFSAFFWRNSLTGRYDQGFLTQLGTDLKILKQLLRERTNFPSALQWAQYCDAELKELFEVELPTAESLVDLLTRGRLTGAIKKALLLPLIGGAGKDLLDSDRTLSFPEASDVELHHIYPRDWCRSNVHGALADVLNEDRAGRNYCESVANLMPLSRVSNKSWRAKIPGQALRENGLTFNPLSEQLEKIFIDRQAFEILVSNNIDPRAFWEHRATLIAQHLERRMQVRI